MKQIDKRVAELTEYLRKYEVIEKLMKETLEDIHKSSKKTKSQSEKPSSKRKK